jgi:hypothetical protein
MRLCNRVFAKGLESATSRSLSCLSCRITQIIIQPLVQQNDRELSRKQSVTKVDYFDLKHGVIQGTGTAFPIIKSAKVGDSARLNPLFNHFLKGEA